MSDRTTFQLSIAECPPEEVADLYKVLDRHLGDLEEPIELGEFMQFPEMVLGTATAVSTRIIETCPGVSFEAYEDPAYEHLGDLWIRDGRNRATFTSDCDSQGRAVFTAGTILEAAAGSPGYLREVLGEPVRRAHAAVQAETRGNLLPRPTSTLENSSATSVSHELVTVDEGTHVPRPRPGDQNAPGMATEVLWPNPSSSGSAPRF